MDLISVIVPVYGVEEYFDRCVESIVRQTYTNLEIILVDDGSPDRCPMMCDEWKRRDSRIQVYHISNNGAGNARNFGTEVASGSWISYIDADDYIAPNFYEYLLSICDCADLVECSILLTQNDLAMFPIVEQKKDSIVVADAETALRLHVRDAVFKQTPPNKLCRASIAKAVQFPVGKLIDDEYWTYQIIGKCRKLVHSDFNLYAYRQRSGSAMHSYYSLKRLQAIEAKVFRLEYLRSSFPNLEREAKNNLRMSCLFHGQQAIKLLAEAEKQSAISFLKRTIDAIPLKWKDFEGVKVTHAIWIWLEYISFETTCRIRNYLKIG